MRSNKTVIYFLIKFIGSYVLLFFLYSIYLNSFQKVTPIFACDPLTEAVAVQSKYVLNVFGFDTEIEHSTSELSYHLILEGKNVARVIEGCTAISIIILFISFIIAFAGNFKSTIIYILFGSIIIYVVNILRIAIIAIALYHFPAYEYMLHDIIFPGIIYGLTFLLWVFWVLKFSKYR